MTKLSVTAQTSHQLVDSPSATLHCPPPGDTRHSLARLSSHRSPTPYECVSCNLSFSVLCWNLFLSQFSQKKRALPASGSNYHVTNLVSSSIVRKRANMAKHYIRHRLSSSSCSVGGLTFNGYNWQNKRISIILKKIAITSFQADRLN